MCSNFAQMESSISRGRAAAGACHNTFSCMACCPGVSIAPVPGAAQLYHAAVGPDKGGLCSTTILVYQHPLLGKLCKTSVLRVSGRIHRVMTADLCMQVQRSLRTCCQGGQRWRRSWGLSCMRLALSERWVAHDTLQCGMHANDLRTCCLSAIAPFRLLKPSRPSPLNGVAKLQRSPSQLDGQLLCQQFLVGCEGDRPNSLSM